MKEEEIIKGCLQNNLKHQQVLYEKYSDILYVICLKYAQNRQQAEDVLQESFLIIYTSIKKFKGSGSFEGWMKRIAINQSISRFKKEIRFSPLLDELHPESVEIETEIIESIPLDVILSQIQALPAQYRLVFNLYEMDGFTHNEISNMLSISVGTSKSNFHRAKLILREKLCQWRPTIKNHSYGI